jgi:hypothetical protein
MAALPQFISWAKARAIGMLAVLAQIVCRVNQHAARAGGGVIDGSNTSIG